MFFVFVAIRKRISVLSKKNQKVKVAFSLETFVVAGKWVGSAISTKNTNTKVNPVFKVKLCTSDDKKDTLHL